MKGRLKVDSDYQCKKCSVNGTTVGAAIGKKKNPLLEYGESIECVEELCYLGYMLNCEGARRSSVTAFIANRLDYCNTILCVLAGAIQRLQVVLNVAARFIGELRKYDHVTPFIRHELHRLPALQRASHPRSQFLLSTAFAAPASLLQQSTHPIVDHFWLRCTRAAERGNVIVLACNTKIGSRSFHITAPTHYHNSCICLLLADSKSGLKTHLFK